MNIDANPTLTNLNPAMTGQEMLRLHRLNEANWNRLRVVAEAAGLTPHKLIEWIDDHVHGEAEVARCDALFNEAKGAETFAASRRRISDTEALTNPRLRVEDHPIAPIVKGGQGRECSPAMAVLVLVACLALPVIAVLAYLARGA